ncbi:hypothetical protein MMC11_006103 [Xylographa trunciseda]|nr:hypothetical protein [Xylographa trunciseda]
MQRVPAALQKLPKSSLINQLSEIRKESYAQRIQIISPELCDDALIRLESTLKDYVGCDIIDINPGACLWSTKVHERLKPRRHILVEPLPNVYDRFIRPLVDAPGSRYALADLNIPLDKWNLGDYIAKDLLPEQAHVEDLGVDSPDGNTTLLVLANMSRNTRASIIKGNIRKTIDSHYRVFEYVRALEARSGFHSKGPVRMLMWMLDQEKVSILPRTIASRRRLSVCNELSCDVEEIVGGTVGPHVSRREAYIDLQSSLLTAERMKKSGVVVPVNRMDELPRKLRSDGIDAVIQSTRHSNSATRGNRTWHKELDDLRKGFADGSYSQFVGGLPGYEEKKRKNEGKAVSPEYRKMQRLNSIEKSQRKDKAAVDDILINDAQIRALQLAITSDEHMDDKAHKMQELDELVDRYRKLLARQNDTRLNAIHFFADDRVAWSGDSSLLMWDHRTAEPIVAQADEFYEPKTLALLDFRPKVSSLQSLTIVQQRYLDEIVLSLFTRAAVSIVPALDSMAPGAADAIIPNAPSLRDPRRGGRMDLDQLRARVLTPEMLREIAVAWDGWLFKPTLAEMSRYIPQVDYGPLE